MKLGRLALVTGVAVAVLWTVAGPAGADSGAALRAGDVVCTDQVQSDTGLYISAHVTNGTGAVEIRTASSVDGAETTVWQASGPNVSVIQTLAVPASDRYFRACVRVTAATSNTWYKLNLSGTDPAGQADLGRDQATLSPGARACGDSGTGPVRLEGTASAPVRWSIFGTDTDYASVGEIFATSGTAVDHVFTPGPDIAGEEMCITNTSSSRVTATYELTSA